MKFVVVPHKVLEQNNYIQNTILEKRVPRSKLKLWRDIKLLVNQLQGDLGWILRGCFLVLIVGHVYIAVITLYNSVQLSY